MIVVIPMAGQGKRFQQTGYTFPKPLIPIRNKPMLQWVVESLDMPWAKHIFVVRREDYERYPLEEVCAQLVHDAHVVIDDHPEGAATSVLLGLTGPQSMTENLLIANADQWLEWDSNNFLKAALALGVDGAIPVFRSVHPKWSYARVEEGKVTEVAEKRPISPWATCGLYYWREVGTFIGCAQEMMREESKRFNGEWYVAPVYNELIQRGGRVITYDKLTMWGLGTPEDLFEFQLRVCR